MAVGCKDRFEAKRFSSSFLRKKLNIIYIKYYSLDLLKNKRTEVMPYKELGTTSFLVYQFSSFFLYLLPRCMRPETCVKLIKAHPF